MQPNDFMDELWGIYAREYYMSAEDKQFLARLALEHAAHDDLDRPGDYGSTVTQIIVDEYGNILPYQPSSETK